MLRTVSLSTTKKPERRKGLFGPLTYEAQRGMFVNPTYAATPQREPLGILDAWMWARERKGDSA